MYFAKVYFPGSSYSESKNAVKWIFRKYKCLWHRERSGWFNPAEGLSVEATFEGSKRPATFLAKGPKAFIKELIEHFEFNGGELQEEGEEDLTEENLPYDLREETINHLLAKMKEDLEEPRFDHMTPPRKEAVIDTARRYWGKERAKALEALK